MAGRPTTYDSKYNKKIFKLCLLGATDKEIADFLEIAESTLNNWKLKYPELVESLKRGKEVADQKVSNSLYKRAIGFKFDEVTHEEITIKDSDGSGGKILKPAQLVKTVRKLSVPDTTAQIFWLKNRRPDKWRDKQDIQIEGDLITKVVYEPASRGSKSKGK